MKKILICLFLTAGFSVFSFAQKGAEKNEVKTAQKKMQVQVSTAAASVQSGQAQKVTKADDKKNLKSVKGNQKTDEEDEYSEVMVDTPDPDAYKAAYFIEEKSSDEKEDAAALPYLYGDLKGSFNDGAKNIMVFENEDGVITFIQVFLEKNTVSWKFLNQLSRN